MHELKTVLIGAGGHAKVVYDCLNYTAHGFCDGNVESFFDIKKLSEEQLNASEHKLILSFGAVSVDGLKRRMNVFQAYLERSFKFTNSIHVSAIIAKTATIASGVLIAPGTIINPDARISANAIINSGAIIEHDVVISEGAHIAPGATILGGAKIGIACMVGANAVVLPGAVVPDYTLIKANSIYPQT